MVTAQNSCHLNNLYYKEKDESNKSEKIAELVERYYDIFSGMGEMKGVTVTLDVDKNVKPIAQKHPCPFPHAEKSRKRINQITK